MPSPFCPRVLYRLALVFRAPGIRRNVKYHDASSLYLHIKPLSLPILRSASRFYSYPRYVTICRVYVRIFGHYIRISVCYGIKYFQPWWKIKWHRPTYNFGGKLFQRTKIFKYPLCSYFSDVIELGSGSSYLYGFCHMTLHSWRLTYR